MQRKGEWAKRRRGDGEPGAGRAKTRLRQAYVAAYLKGFSPYRISWPFAPIRSFASHPIQYAAA
jgi:hypothetical protein